MEKVFMIGGIEFSEKTYEEIIDNYGETFTHTSLSIEKEYLLLEEFNSKLQSILNKDDVELDGIVLEDRMEAINKYHYFVVYMGYFKGMVPKIDFDNQDLVDKVYNENFKDFNRFMGRLLVIDDGKFLFKETGQKVSMFFPVYIERKPILKKAEDSRLDHIEAFAYALSRRHIGISEIKLINSIVNRSNPNREEGFKKINNVITGASFETMKKEEIPNQVAELLYKYDNDFGLEIKSPFEDGITSDERYDRMFLICLKESMFHIAFEHLHPFSDGNGRTGRIIMSSNMMRQMMAPPLITSVMLEKYKKFIDGYDYQGLAQMILDSSSQTLSTWVTIKREEEGTPIEEVINSKTL